MAARRRVRRRVRRSRARLRRAPTAAALGARAEAKQKMDPAGGVLIGGVRDPAERAADRLADEAMRQPAAEPAVHRMCDECEEESQEKAQRQPAAEPTVHRMCDDCEEESQEKAQRRPAAGAAGPVATGAAPAPATAGASRAIHALGPGRPLPEAERAGFESRFGADLSGVRLHDDAAGDRAARSIDARAFTLGNDVAFARGERQPGTPGGDRLMAHELAHVVQAGGAARRSPVAVATARRAALATKDLDTNFKKVPTKHKPRVKAGLKLIEKQIKAKKCAAYFKDKCSGGAVDELKKAFKDSTVYWLDQKSALFGSSKTRTKTGDARSIAYNTTAYDIGRWELGATLLHEMFHTCIIGSIADEERVAETGVETCEFYTPWIHIVSTKSAKVGDTVVVTGAQFGPKHDAEHRITLGGTDVTPLKWDFNSASGVEISFKVPAGAKSGDIVVTNHSVKSNKRRLEVTP